MSGRPDLRKQNRIAKWFPDMSEVTLLVLDADPTRLAWAGCTGRARILHADESTLAGQLPLADVLLVWDFTSHAVRARLAGRGPAAALGAHRERRAWTVCSAPN